MQIRRRYPHKLLIETSKPVKEPWGWGWLMAPRPPVGLLIFAAAWATLPMLWGIYNSQPRVVVRGFVRDVISPTCADKPRRIERFLPTYKLGCYLGGVDTDGEEDTK